MTQIIVFKQKLQNPNFTPEKYWLIEDFQLVAKLKNAKKPFWFQTLPKQPKTDANYIITQFEKNKMTLMGIDPIKLNTLLFSVISENTPDCTSLRLRCMNLAMDMK